MPSTRTVAQISSVKRRVSPKCPANGVCNPKKGMNKTPSREKQNNAK
jgi:hypothetical protein